MTLMRIVITFLILFVCSGQFLSAQQDTTEQYSDTLQNTTLKKSFWRQIPYKEIAIPAGLLTYGIISRESHFLIHQDNDINNVLRKNIDGKFTIDDFSQYTPLLSIYVLDLAGIKARHNLRERLFVSGVSYAIMATTVYTIKSTGNVWRPDNSANNSFPSGHAATAFAGAELLWQEYKDQSIWYGIAGYTVAAGTGFFRMYNNKHWFSDVVMGAGIGMLSTKIGYWLLPLVDKHLQHNPSSSVTVVAPFYNGKQAGLSASVQF